MTRCAQFKVKNSFMKDSRLLSYYLVTCSGTTINKRDRNGNGTKIVSRQVCQKNNLEKKLLSKTKSQHL